MFTRPAWVALALTAVLVLASASAAHADLTRIAGPTFVYNEVGTINKFDAAFDSANQVYLLVWGRSASIPAAGQLLNAGGAPLGGPFQISDGSLQAGWARVIYSPEQGKFLIAYTKIMSPGVHRRIIRTATYQSGGIALGPEIVVDTWNGGAGEASGIAYSRGRWLVTWWNWDAGAFPQTFLSIYDAAGNLLVWKKQITLSGDGETDPEIACDQARGRCLVIGQTWGVFGGAVPGTWATVIKDDTGDPVKPLFYAHQGPIEKEPTVTYSAAGDRFILAFSNNQNAVLGMTMDGASLNTSAAYMIRQPTDDPSAVGFGRPRLVYNAATQTSAIAIKPWIATTGIMELDAAGAIRAHTWQMTPLVTTNFAAGTQEIAPASDPANSRFLVADQQAYLTVRATVWSASGGGGTPPPPPPPPTPPPTCSYSVSPSNVTLTATQQTGSINVTTTSGCAWSASSSASWLTLGAASGTGSGTATFMVVANTTLQARTGTISIAGQTFTVTQQMLSPAAVHDVSGDRLSDIIWHHQTSGELAVWYLNGPTVTATYFLSIKQVADTNWKVVGTGDLNGDGLADLVWQHSSGALAVWTLSGPQVVYTLFLSGSLTDTNWRLRAVGDVNGDGKSDLLWQHETLGHLAVWFMNGHIVTGSTFLSVSNMPDPNWKIAGAGDINADGRADILWQNQATGQLGAWLLNGAVVIGQQAINGVADLNWKVRGVGDVNGDGSADLIWQNTNTGGLGVWYLNGFSVIFQSNLSIGTVGDTNWHVVGPG